MKGIVGVASNLLHDKVMEAWQDSSEVRLIVYFIYLTEASLFRLLEHDARAYIGGGGGGGGGGQPYPFERFHAVSIIGMKLTFFGQESHKGGQEYMNADDVIDFVHTS